MPSTFRKMACAEDDAALELPAFVITALE